MNLLLNRGGPSWVNQSLITSPDSPTPKHDSSMLKEQTKFEEYLFSSEIEKEDCQYFKVTSIEEG